MDSSACAAPRRAFVCGVSIGCHRSRGAPLAAFPPRCAAQPCRSQLPLRNKSFYSWHRGCAPSLLRWVLALGAERAAARDLRIYSLEKEAASLPWAPCSPAGAGRAGGAVNYLPAQPRGSHPPMGACGDAGSRVPHTHAAFPSRTRSGGIGECTQGISQAGSPQLHGSELWQAVLGPVPGRKGAGQGGTRRYGRQRKRRFLPGAASQPAVRWSHSPWSGSFLAWTGGHEHQHGLGTRMGWVCCMSHCSSGMFPTGSCPAGSEGRPWAPQKHPTAPPSQLSPGSRSQGCQEG